MKAKVLGVIPARLGSTRLPRKPLQLLLGEPLIAHTYRAAFTCPELDRLIVATDSEEVADVIRRLGGEVMITPSSIATGTDRVAYVTREIKGYDVILNIQGDEPMLTHSMISALVTPFKSNPSTSMSTIACPLDWAHEYTNPDHVKVLIANNGNALYFSRSPIPYLRECDGPIPHVYKHMGAYGFRRDFLLQFTQMAPTSFELAEKLEQLRALQNGFPIHVGVVAERTVEINRPNELLEAEAAMLAARKTT